MRATIAATIKLSGKKIEYRIVPSHTAKKIRLRVGPLGIHVIMPTSRPAKDLDAFFRANKEWIMNQIDRVKRLGLITKAQKTRTEILYRGNRIPVNFKIISHRCTNKIISEDDKFFIITGNGSCIDPAKSLENWLRKDAKKQISLHLSKVLPRLGKSPQKILVMGQRTKWGNCSRLHNLSFNWRLIMAPDFVLRYIVTHEATHLVVPDHSKKFWLMVRSLSPEMERAKQWLVLNGEMLLHESKTKQRFHA